MTVPSYGVATVEELTAFFDALLAWGNYRVKKSSTSLESISTPVYKLCIYMFAKDVIYLNEEQRKGLVFMANATIRKWGNSLAIRIPHEVTDRVNFDDGVQVEIFVTENKEVLLRPAFPAADNQDALRKHFLALRAKCKPGAVSHEEVFAEPMGDELI